MARRHDGQVVLITGASSGIGAACAEAFAREGARVALCARRADKLDEVRARVEAAGGEALALACDVCERASIEAAVAQTVERWGRLDVVLANAGFGVAAPLARLETGDYRRQFETNVFGVLDTLYATLPHLRAQRGRFGIVGSISGRVGTPGTTAYCASKFALTGFAEGAWHELADQGVSLTLINPGLVRSEIRHKDNHGVLTERPDPAPAWLVMPTEVAAHQMVRALHRRRAEVTITRHGKIIVWIWRHAPRLSRALVRLNTRGKFRDKPRRNEA